MKIIVIGGGPAGMISAIFAARNGHDVILVEKNEKLGKKLFITGKGRCNITNACDIQDLFQNIVSNPKFMYSGIYSFTNQDVIDFFEELGLKTKIERGNRVFPLSDKSSDVISVLSKELKNLGVDLLLKTQVSKVIIDKNRFVGVNLKDEKEILKGDKVIIATGGLSYQVTGSTGDGYNFAKNIGHTVSSLYPSLVPLNIKESHIIEQLQGLSLKNVAIKILLKNKVIFSDFGEMIFTHFGVSGPLILSGSSFCTTYLPKNELTLHIDLKARLSIEQLDERILSDFTLYQNKQFKNSLNKLLPRKLIPVIIQLSGINPDKKVNIITKEERLKLVHLIKELPLHITSCREFKEAIITKGGVKVSEINPSNMESKLVDGVHFAGELLDLDGLTGGYNLQIAWSTGFLAGNG